jgi:DNA-binding response OmpR family regulator
VRLLLIEDDAVIARELLLRWRSRGWSAELCESLRTADQARLREPSSAHFELIVLDLGLPDGDGIDWLRQLRRGDRWTPVIVLTARDRVADRVLGLHEGADDYLVKPFHPEELDARIHALQRRGHLNHGDSLSFGRITWLGEEGRAHVDGRPLELAPREFEVLGLLVRRAPRLLSRRALMDALAERNLEVGDSAADIYISRLRRKLAHSGATIRTLRGFGYLLELSNEGGSN